MSIFLTAHKPSAATESEGQILEQLSLVSYRPYVQWLFVLVTHENRCAFNLFLSI